jgi:antitoxin (DNA-binding transcriptional repressor) of toxin-antitoxin stability system
MQQIIVTIEEAHEHLPELIARVAAGDYVVIAEAGKSIARLTKPSMFPATPEEIRATEQGRIDFIRDYVESRDREGNPVPADHPLRTLLTTRKAE